MLEKLKASFSSLIKSLKGKSEGEETKKEEEKKEEKEKEEEKLKLSAKTKLKAIVAKKIKISKEDFEKMFSDFELELLEANVQLEAVEEIKKELEIRIVDKEFEKREFEKEIKKEIREALLEYLKKSYVDFDIVEFCKKAEKPVKILFIGPNGSGKTTAIAKVAKILKENNLSCVFSASDTYRAAA
ncbi:MAG: signal recognition particle receptor subunit alpha, partial [Candidatus Micrarchaeales archaeon]